MNMNMKKPRILPGRFAAHRRAALSGLGLSALLLPDAVAAEILVTVRNLAPAAGTYLTPVWVAFHDGTFDLFNAGNSASAGLEQLAEDGNPSGLATAFAGGGHGTTAGLIFSGGAIPPFAPGDLGAMTFSVNPFDPMNRYLSFASMVIPSNDAFIANGDPLMIPVFDGGGGFLGGTYTIFGSMVWDAGTEVNDELPANTAFFVQATPDTGAPENGVVALHTGFLAPGQGGILDDPMFAGADFTQAGYAVAEITVSVVPEPQTYAAVVALGLLGFAGWRRWRKS